MCCSPGCLTVLKLRWGPKVGQGRDWRWSRVQRVWWHVWSLNCSAAAFGLSLCVPAGVANHSTLVATTAQHAHKQGCLAAAGAVESVVARVCREAGGRFTTNVMLRDPDMALPDVADGRRLEVVADGLPLFGGAQLVIDTLLCAPSAETVTRRACRGGRRCCTQASSPTERKAVEFAPGWSFLLWRLISCPNSRARPPLLFFRSLEPWVFFPAASFEKKKKQPQWTKSGKNRKLPSNDESKKHKRGHQWSTEVHDDSVNCSCCRKDKMKRKACSIHVCARVRMSFVQLGCVCLWISWRCTKQTTEKTAAGKRHC